jgi:hypothetical protein
MPVLQTEDEIIPRSIIRHRPLKDTTPSGARRSITTSASYPPVQRASRTRPAASDSMDDIAEWRQEGLRVDTRPPVKERDIRRPTTTTRTESRPPVTRSSRLRGERITRVHPLLYLGVGMLAMFMLWTLLTAIFGWFNTTMDDLHYGRPRTFQVDAWVGHEQTGVPSHFIAINLHRHIEIIELPGGDAAHAHIYVGPQLYGAGDDLIPVTLNFEDVNADHKPDMLVNFQGSRTVFINDQGTFRPAQPSERQQIEKFLQQQGQHSP